MAEVVIRFVDIRGQGTEHRFAFWDTVTSRFLSFSGEHAWDTWDGDCADAIATDLAPADPAATLARLRGLCPQWAFEADDGKHEGAFWGEVTTDVTCTRVGTYRACGSCIGCKAAADA